MSFSLENNIPDLATNTHTYHSPLINSSQFAEPCLLGVDEAGRGPVVGPMVYACAYCPLSYKEDLAKCGYNDSKALTAATRQKLLEKIRNDENVGWTIKALSARDISAGMLKPKVNVYNLNSQAHDATMSMITEVLQRGVNVTEVYVDTVGPPATYQQKLSRRFPGIKFTVAKKADALYPIVSAASICAKVTRDECLEHHDESSGVWGSGYPSDGKTINWLKSSLDPLFGFSGNVRFSWGTITELMQKNGVEAKWADDYEEESKKKVKGALKYFTKSNENDPASLAKSKELPLSTRWYGSDGGSDELWL